ncbi:MAG: hypothetical protein IT444_12335 [Phycisphaeraceae bacterium]|nr:hypothetical protein [Phycisphaeraceae bacterium]
MRFYLAEAFVELRTDNTKLNAGLQAARKETEKTVTIFSRMKGAAMGALGMLGAAGSAAVAVYFIQRLVRMAAEAEQQTMRFNSALRGAGVASAKMR